MAQLLVNSGRPGSEQDAFHAASQLINDDQLINGEFKYMVGCRTKWTTSLSREHIGDRQQCIWFLIQQRCGR
jgi:hypothetical protein